MRRTLFALFLCLTPPAFAGGLGDMTDAERGAFQAEVRAYLIENPQVLVEAMNALQSRQDIAAAKADTEMLAKYHDQLFSDPDSFVGGNPQGDITIVEFTDYRCTYCRKAFSEIQELVKTDGNIRFVVKEYPILGDASLISTQFAISVLLVQGEDAYLRAHDALITLRGEPDAATLGALAKKLGFDPAPILAQMASPEVAAIIAANHTLGAAMDITGTPTFVVQGQLLRGYLPLAEMQKIVASERAAG